MAKKISKTTITVESIQRTTIRMRRIRFVRIAPICDAESPKPHEISAEVKLLTTQLPHSGEKPIKE